MSQFDMGNLGAMFGMVQQRIQDFKDQAASIKCEGTAADGLVRVVMTGDQQCLSVSISEEAMGDRELLEDLVRAANADALRQVKEQTSEQMKQLTGGLPIPPGLLNF